MIRIHREGYRIITVAFAFLFVVNIPIALFCAGAITCTAVFCSSLLLIFLLRFFRVPKRNFNNDSSAIYSSADGTVVAIEEIFEEQFLNTRCIQVSVFMSIWNVHINWYPIEGEVKLYKYEPGSYFVARHPKSSVYNERTSVVVERPDGVQILIRQIAGALARRIVCYATDDQKVEQFDELGFIKFGSRVDLFLPLEATIHVEIGQKVVGNITKLATV